MNKYYIPRENRGEGEKVRGAGVRGACAGTAMSACECPPVRRRRGEGAGGVARPGAGTAIRLGGGAGGRGGVMSTGL